MAVTGTAYTAAEGFPSVELQKLLQSTCLKDLLWIAATLPAYRQESCGAVGAAQGLSHSIVPTSSSAPSHFPPPSTCPAPIFLGPHSIADAAATAAPAVVNITVVKGNLPIPQDQSGTGFIYNASQGYILTNAHVVARALPTTEQVNASNSNASSCSSLERQNSGKKASTSRSDSDERITVALQDGRVFQGSVLMFDRYAYIITVHANALCSKPPTL